MTQTEDAVTIAARLLAERDNSRTAREWQAYLMDEAARESDRSFEALLEKLWSERKQP